MPKLRKFLRTPIEASAFIRSIQFQLARNILRRVRAFCPSDTLKNALQFYEVFDGRAVIAIPHYWAVYLNDGTQGFGPNGGKFLVWFRDPLGDDPRLGGRYPVRYDEWRPLSKEEFQFGIDLNKAFGGPALVGPFMVAVTSVGPRGGSHFFEKGFEGFLGGGGSELIQKRFSAYVRRYVLKKANAKETAVIPPIRFRLR